jgi:hypothetical protein
MIVARKHAGCRGYDDRRGWRRAGDAPFVASYPNAIFAGAFKTSLYDCHIPVLMSSLANFHDMPLNDTH